MVTQKVNLQDNEIEITISHKDIPSWFASLFYGDSNQSKIIKFYKDKEILKIGFSGGEVGDIIYFDHIKDIIVHKYKYSQCNNLEYQVALILNTNVKYLALYSYIEPEFGNKLFSAIEHMLFNKNEPLKIYEYEEAKLIFEL